MRKNNRKKDIFYDEEADRIETNSKYFAIQKAFNDIMDLKLACPYCGFSNNDIETEPEFRHFRCKTETVWQGTCSVFVQILCPSCKCAFRVDEMMKIWSEEE